LSISAFSTKRLILNVMSYLDMFIVASPINTALLYFLSIAVCENVLVMFFTFALNEFTGSVIKNGEVGYVFEVYGNF
jgi:hypothetical protein